MNVNSRFDFANLIPKAGLLAGALALTAVKADADEFKGAWAESGIETRMRGFRPISLIVSNEVPQTLKQAPEGLPEPLYGAFQTGPEKSPLIHHVILTARDNLPVTLWIDANADGEFAKDEVFEWEAREYTKPDDTKVTNYFSSATVKLNAGGLKGQVKVYLTSFDASKPSPNKRLLSWYSDFGVTGEIQIGGRTYQAALNDPPASTEFSVRAAPLLWLDLDGDGKGGARETVPASRPFEVAGKWWAVTNLTVTGSFQVVASAKPDPAKDKPTGPDLSPGRKAPAFTAKQMDGKTLKFPEDYKGKIVLVDFWATWCGPCLAEVPNVVKTYEKFHSQGLEVLGISLDREGAEEQIAKVAENKKMSWPQVYDGKFWSAEIAKLYGVQGIPHMLLVDGNTGLILANKDIRGEKLGEAIQKALDENKK